MSRLAAVLLLCAACAAPAPLGRVKHIVFVTGDEEYRSEEGMPMLARILADRHGFTCTVLYSIHRATGEIHPDTRDNIPGLEALGKADLLVLFTRFRELPDDQMKHIADYVRSGRPIIALRTSTHAFAYRKGSRSAYAAMSWDAPDGGFGKQVLGETWVAHHGAHGSQSTRGVIASDHPVVRGCEDIWGPSDVYAVRKLPDDAQALVMGQVVAGMKPTDKPVDGAKNDPMMPIAWIRTRPSRVFVTTMGASQDFLSEGLRRLLVNACTWAVGLDVPARANVDIVGTYEPAPFGFGGYRKGVKP